MLFILALAAAKAVINSSETMKVMSPDHDITKNDPIISAFLSEHGAKDGINEIETGMHIDESGRRHLLPHDHGGPLHHHPHFGDTKGGYLGCLGLSEEELAEAWIFEEEMIPCSIGNDWGNGGSSTSGSNGGSSSNGSSGGTSEGSGGSGSSSGGSSNGSDASDGGSSSNGSSPSGSDGDSNGSSNGSTSSSGFGGDSGSDFGYEGNDYDINGNNDGSTGSNPSSGGSSNGSNSSSGSDGSTNGGDSSSVSNGDESQSGHQNDGGDEEDGGDQTDLNEENNGGSGDVDDDNYVDDNFDGEEHQYPLRYFNISECTTYSNFWVWDLALTCDNATSLSNCQCKSASILFQYGELECPGTYADSPSCPVGCPVCHTCMQLLGCPTADNAQSEQRIINGSTQEDNGRTLPVIIGLAVTALAIGGLAYAIRRNARNGKQGGTITSSLMDDPPIDTFV